MVLKLWVGSGQPRNLATRTVVVSLCSEHPVLVTKATSHVAEICSFFTRFKKSARIHRVSVAYYLYIFTENDSTNRNAKNHLAPHRSAHNLLQTTS